MDARKCLALAPVALVLLTVGCSRSAVAWRPNVVPVSGRVLYKGQPLAGAHVTFLNLAAKRAAWGRTDADGKFALTTFEPGDGAVPGKQQVSVSKVQIVGNADANVDRTATTGKVAGPERRWLIPEHYGSFATSGLSAEVSEGGPNEIVLELKAAG